jgi:hypothetical protein
LVLQGGTVVPRFEDSLEVVRSRPHGDVAAVLGTARRRGLEGLLSARRCPQRDWVMAMIVARVVNPRSKLATARALDPDTLDSTLGELLGLETADADELYAALDWLLARQERIEQKLAARHLADGSLVLYDVTSTYFEGRCCPLARLGHSRDGKSGKLQIVFGLLCSADGCPVAVEVFEGNTSDPQTFRAQVEKVRRRFAIERVVWVGDRGMITEARIREDLRGVEGLDWITALRAPQIRELVAKGALQLSLFDQQDLAEITSDEYPGERLIACRNPFLAQERARKREELLQATERELDQIVAATTRRKRPLRGRDRIGLRVGKVLHRFKMGKHLRLQITEDAFSYARDPERIAAEAALDGIYIIRTSVPAEALDPQQTVSAYKSLSHVERAFRSYKTLELKVRPIFHRLALPLPAGLLRRVAYAARSGGDALRRSQSPGRPRTPRLDRGPRPTLHRSRTESPPEAHRRRPARPQLPHAAGGPPNHRPKPPPAKGRRPARLRQDHPPHPTPAARLRPTRGPSLMYPVHRHHP